MGDGVGVDTVGDVVLVEDDVVGERLVVHELDGLTLGDGDLVGLFDERRVARKGQRGVRSAQKTGWKKPAVSFACRHVENDVGRSPVIP